MGKKRGKHIKRANTGAVRGTASDQSSAEAVADHPGYVAGVAIWGERGAALGLLGYDESSSVLPTSAPVFSAPEIQCCRTCKMAEKLPS